MILTKEVEILSNPKHYKYYKNLGYNPIIVGHNKGNKFNVKVEHLALNSHQKILCSCDICGKEKYVKYLNYNKYLSTDPNHEYTCEKCNYEKRKSKIYKSENVSQCKDIKEKKVNTMLNNGKELFWCRKEEHKEKIKEIYGVEYISQNMEIHLKQQNGYITKHYNGLYYRGTYEKNFIDFCLKNNIKIDNFKHSIKYKYQGKEKKYFPDFYYEPLNLIIEIKSNYTYEIEKDKNESKRLGSIRNGFNFIFIIDKEYDEFERTIKNQD